MNAAAPVWRPDPAELLLLRAGLWEPDRAVAAWRRWRETNELDSIEHGSLRQLPLVYRNIGPRLGEEGDPDAGRLKGIYRHTWTINQIAIQAGAEALGALREAGISSLVLKGGALLHLHYPDSGARPMGDFDLAVPEHRGADAVAALREAGLEPASADVARLLEVRHSEAFRDARGHEIDLHVRLLWRPGLEGAMWSAAVPLEIRGERTLALAPADQLLHVCVHGAAWNPISPVRWAADAFEVMQRPGGELDWDRLVELGRRARLTLALAAALRFLADDLEAPVPAAALAAARGDPGLDDRAGGVPGARPAPLAAPRRRPRLVVLGPLPGPGGGHGGAADAARLRPLRPGLLGAGAACGRAPGERAQARITPARGLNGADRIFPAGPGLPLRVVYPKTG